MSRTVSTNKSHARRTIYDRFSNRCPICIKSQGRSKRFDSLYQLLYHINIHNFADEIAADITKEDVRKIVKHLKCALEWKMFLE